ncbi:hypothetical protein [Ornithinimicrobium kibberense]|uniref:hypothetical protein n=1 Tax=Ornithinimicrobium kibberense TaxID=282060 RepID=UPI00361D1A0F
MPRQHHVGAGPRALLQGPPPRAKLKSRTSAQNRRPAATNPLVTRGSDSSAPVHRPHTACGTRPPSPG